MGEKRDFFEVSPNCLSQNDLAFSFFHSFIFHFPFGPLLYCVWGSFITCLGAKCSEKGSK